LSYYLTDISGLHPEGGQSSRRIPGAREHLWDIAGRGGGLLMAFQVTGQSVSGSGARNAAPEVSQVSLERAFYKLLWSSGFVPWLLKITEIF